MSEEAGPRRSAQIAAAFAGWRPPQQVTVTLTYADGQTEELWTAEAALPPPGAFEEDGGLPLDCRWFVAVGPAGKPLRPVVDSTISGLPDGANVVVVTGLDELGQHVFRRIGHQLN